MELGKVETQEILDQISNEMDRLSTILLDKKEMGLKETAAYKARKYQYDQIGKARDALNNARMCLLSDFC